MSAPDQPTPVRVRCERLVAGGAALARDEGGRVLFVTGADAGELVDVHITASRRDVAHGVVAAVLEPSADRVLPPCPQVARGCGGCDWQHLSVDAQRRARRAIVRESLTRVGRLDGDAVDAVLHSGPPIAALPADAVRTTLRLAIDAEGRPGFRAARSHDVVATDHCLVAHPLLAEMLPLLRLPGASEATVRLAVASGERGVWWTPSEVRPLAGLPTDVRIGEAAVVHETIAGAVLRVSPGSFFQPSAAAAEAIVAAVRRAVVAPLAGLAADELVVDAYAGIGLLAVTVLSETSSILAIEGSRSACADAEVNLANRDARVLRCSVERWRPEPAALVIADPARSGLGREACSRLLGASPRDVVLVSCDPASLGRDAALLATSGYRLVSCEVLDAFPHTHHVETVSRFTCAD